MTNKILLTIAIALTLGALYIYQPKVQESFGSVASGSESQSTTTRAIPGSSLADPTVLCSTNGVLNNVVITGAGTGIMNFYDGTTTSSHSDHATRTIASFPASTAAGTYTFDVVTFRGLIFDQDGGNTATSTITYKCN